VRDIFEGRVAYQDVLIVISRTAFDPTNDDHWKSVWEGYVHGGVSNPIWHGLDDHETEIREICQQLYKWGKLHQPRQYGSGNPFRADYVWLDTIVSDDDLEHKPAVKKAWEQYKILAGLTN
jgi:cytochrome oxidase Cu insertion factor (SCO1/SenC/PrrC family)